MSSEKEEEATRRFRKHSRFGACAENINDPRIITNDRLHLSLGRGVKEDISKENIKQEKI